MKLLLILFVLAVALAPLTHFIPSKRQRQVTRLREYAALHGLFVEFRDLPGSGHSRVGRDQRPRQIIYYGKRLAPSRSEPRSRLAWLAADGAWQGVGHRVATPSCAALLPAEILGLSQEEGSCGIYWAEPGQEAQVQQIVDALEAWAAELREG